MAFPQHLSFNAGAEYNSAFDRHYSTHSNHSGRKSIASTLDSATADSGIMSPDLHDQFRRDSVTNSAGVLSPPVDIKWDPKAETHGLGIHNAPFASTNPFQMSDNPFARPNAIDAGAHLVSDASPWSFEEPSGTCTPSSFDVYTGDDFDAGQYSQRTIEQSSSDYASFTPIQQEPGFLLGNRAQSPTPSTSNANWMSATAPDQQGRRFPRRMQLSGTARTTTSFLRPEGVRKKNTRIDIPIERNKDTIEQLIEEAKDEDQVKELKAQRRLLRNREAALLSRQRKKQHTEDLEVEKKNYVSQINALEVERNDLHLRYANAERDKQFLSQQAQEACQMVEALKFEKQELILKHTEETGLLRRRVQHLTEQLDAGSTPIMSAATSSTGFNQFTSEMDALNMGPQLWNDFGFMQDQHQFDQQYGINSTSGLSRQVKATKSTEVNRTSTGTVDQPVASGILFMLLLCGAYVTSKSSSVLPPPMPEEVRAASTTVLESLLGDSRADVLCNSDGRSSLKYDTNLEPAPSATAWRHPSTTSGDALGMMHHQLTVPSRVQEAEQLFSMTPAQYNAMTDYEHSSPHHETSIPGPSRRRNLAQTLANMREESIAKGGAAEVYTRSLLWDQIPADVVTQFMDLVQASKTSEVAARRQSASENKDHGNSHSSSFNYKMEPMAE